MSIDNTQYSFLPFIKLLTSTPQLSLLARIKNHFNLSENVLSGNQKIPQALLTEIFNYCESNNETGIAFNYGLSSESGSLGLLDYYLASCEDVETAANQLVYFFPIIFNSDCNPKISVNHKQQLVFTIPDEDANYYLEKPIKEQCFASVIALFIRLCNHHCPAKIEFPQKSFSQSIYQKLTSKGIDIDFISTNYRIVLHPKQHLSTLPFKNEQTRNLIKPELEQKLLESNRVDSIFVEILMLFSSEKNIAYINQNTISEKLNISESSLKRKLAEVGSNFSNILSRFKKEKAIDQLNKQSNSIEKIAEDLGYSDRSSFERAFKQWTSITPSQYLQQTSLAKISLENIKADDIESLPASPTICQQVFELTSTDDFDIPQLCNLIETDPILTGKLISIANSAYYGGNNVSDLNQAIIQTLGVDFVQNMVFSLMCCAKIKIKECPEFELQSFWFQSLLAAEAIKLLNHHDTLKDNISASELFLAALLHKIGEYVLVYLKPKVMRQYLTNKSRSRNYLKNKQNHVEQQQLQKKILGLSTETTGALVLTHWGLPKPVCELIREMDSPYVKQSSAAKMMTLISMFAEHQLYNIEDADIPNDFLQELSVLLNVETSVLYKSLIRVVNKIESISAISKEITNSQ